MIELVMYGMIPSENTANRVSAPPENRSMNCSADRPPAGLAAFCSSASADRLMFGTGTCEPSRNTAMIAEREQDLLAKVRNLERVDERFQHAPGERPLTRAHRGP